MHSYLRVRSLTLKNKTRGSRAHVDLKVSLFQSRSDPRVLKEISFPVFRETSPRSPHTGGGERTDEPDFIDVKSTRSVFQSRLTPVGPVGVDRTAWTRRGASAPSLKPGALLG